MSNPYQAPTAELSPIVAAETLQRRTTAARLSGVGLSIVLIGGGFWSLMVVGSLASFRESPPAAGVSWLSLIITLCACATTVGGGLSLWRLHPLARWLVLPLGLLSLVGMPLVPVVVGFAIWWSWSPMGRTVLSPEGATLRADNADERPPQREWVVSFLLSAAVIGAVQPLAFFVMMVLLV